MKEKWDRKVGSGAQTEEHGRCLFPSGLECCGSLYGLICELSIYIHLLDILKHEYSVS